MDMVIKLLWGIALLLIVYSSIIFSKKIKYEQFNLIKMIRQIKNSSSLMLVLGGRIGVGSIVGVALSIYYGGIGSILYIWISALICAPICFLETKMGIKYSNDVTGGPSYYIKNGLKNSFLAYIYSILIIITFIFGFIAIQANTITSSILFLFDTNINVIAIILTIICTIIIFSGIKNIEKLSNKLVPFMLVFYCTICFGIVFSNFENIPKIICSIFQDGLNIKSISGFFPCLIIGIQRGIFANEAGLGTSVIASSNSKNKDEPYIQTLGIYITTFLICTLTAFVIITSDYQNFNIKSGLDLVMQAFTFHLNYFGNYFLIICILLFSFSTIITGYFYSEKSLEFITLNHKTKLKIITLITIFISSMLNANIIWKMIDFFVVALVIINLYSLIKLKNDI
ncbi:MAG: alanine:cation symporter family protein [Mycoplasmatota bacterium]